MADVAELRRLLDTVDPAFLRSWNDSGVWHCTEDVYACRFPARFADDDESELAVAAVNALTALLDVAEAAEAVAKSAAWKWDTDQVCDVDVPLIGSLNRALARLHGKEQDDG